MTQEELEETLAKHKLWLTGDSAGVRINLRDANLAGANLAGANLTDANLEEANLRRANLEEANLRDATLWDANLEEANLRDATLWGADLEEANLRRADLRGADLRGADLRGAKLEEANLEGAILEEANLRRADLRGAEMRCFGNMHEIRTMQIDTWAIGYTADTLQIGCQRHPIDKWRKWNTPAGRKWIENMDSTALEWADRNLALVLALIDANPATPKGHEGKTDE